MLTRPGLSRRKLLLSVAQNSLLYLPLMRMFKESEALAQVGTQKNAIFCYWPTGTHPNFWPNEGPGDITQWSGSLRPIEASGLKDKFILMYGLGLFGTNDHNGGLTQAFAGWGGAGLVEGIGVGLGSNPVVGSDRNKLPKLESRPFSLDAQLAKRWGVEAQRFGIANTGGTKDSAAVDFDSSLSYGEGGVRLDANPNPKAAYAKLVANFQPSTGGSSTAVDANVKIAKAEKKMIDFLISDLNRVNASLTGEDKALFQAHFAALNEINESIDRTINATPVKQPVGVACSVTDLKGPTDGMGDTNWFNSNNNLPAIADINKKMVVQALACGITRVAVYQIGCGHCNRSMMLDPKNINQENFHGVTHNNYGQYERTQASHFQAFADLANALREVKTSNGTLFDSTMMYGTTESGQLGHDGSNTPVFFLGGKVTKGRKIKEEGALINRALISMAHMMGEKSITNIGMKETMSPFDSLKAEIDA